MEEIHAKVELALDNIRPYLKSDGGDVELLSINDALEVELRLLGNCESCTMSHMTMKAGIEEAIKRSCPEITKVSAVNI